MILAAVASLSLSSLAYELLITRFFSVTQWSHLSFLAIGVAMFGYAAGGAAYGLRAGGGKRDPSPVLTAALAACSLTTIGSFLAVKALPLDYLRFPVDPVQAVYLLLSWIFLSLPFFACGAATVAAYSARPDLSGAIAGASLLGSAAGALVPAALLPRLEEGGCVVVCAVVPLAAGIIGARHLAPRFLSALCIALLAAFFVWQRGGVLAVEPSPYKTLPLLRQAPGTVVTSRTPGLRGRLEVVESPSIRFAPGLSLAWQEELPRQTGLITDGDALSVLYDFSHQGSQRFAAWTHTFAPFIAAGSGDCLILQQDGGIAAACAFASLSRGVVLVVEDPRVARRTAARYRAQALRVIAENPRAYLARADRRFSTILMEDWGPSIPGMASLQSDSLLTTDSFRACWTLLDRDGALAVSRRIVLPPSDSLRLFSEILRALSDAGAADPASHLAVIRSWDSCTIVATREPLRGAALQRLLAFAESRAFDLDYYPGVDPSRTNRFSRYERPLFAEAYLDITRDPGYARRQALDMAPQTDDRPFPSHFVKWTRVRDFSRATGGRAYTLLLTGEIIAGTVLGEVVILGAALLAIMFLPGRRRRGKRHTAGLFFLVGMSGIGFMAMEMYAINAASLLFPSPGVSLSISLGGILLFSALGGAASEAVSRRSLCPILLMASLASAAFCLALPAAVSAVVRAPVVGRVAAALGLLAFPGFLIGVPFPAAMRLLASDSRQRAEAWAVNGCASVIMSAASALVAPAVGLRALLAAAAAAYAVAAAAAAAFQRRPMMP